jgi:alanine-glyoxylate transaminase/serine-glyoxylate transaminase/serine-pyruvate transaminase
MIPGPTEPEPEALAALSLPIMPHYGRPWGEYYDTVLNKLKKIFKTTKSEPMIIPAPGQVAVEMAVESLVRKNEEAYVCYNGFFGEMIADIITLHGSRPALIRGKGYGSAVTLDNVKGKLESKDVSGKVIFLVHNETSTGVTNPAAEIINYCKRKKNMITVLDSISSFGGVDIRVDEWGVDYCVGYASKALGGVFGAVPISVSEEAFRVAKKNASGVNGRFLNLNKWVEYKVKWKSIGHPYPCTMPTSTIVALDKAVDIALAEGLDRRYERHRKVAELARTGLESIGLEIFADKEYASNTVSVAKVTRDQDRLIRSELEEKYDIMIGGGINDLEGKIIRIGHMGTSATIPKISLTLSAIGSILAKQPKGRRHRAAAK